MTEMRMKQLKKEKVNNVNWYLGDAINLYEEWESPTTIVCDGPYGVNGYPGDLLSHKGLAEWYEPHIRAWTEKSTPITTLWFWNTEVGWATVHPILEKYGWEYVSCCIWDKGMSHVAGNVNTKTIRHLPVVTEVCVQYVLKPVFKVQDKNVTMQEWLRAEWQRTGMPMSKTNEACEVKNAATRKYFTKCHLWYMPPVDAFAKLVDFANRFGLEEGKPYFTIDGKKSITKNQWSRMRAKFYCPLGVTNVWQVPQLRNKERLKVEQKAIHLNQKPLELIKRIIDITSDENDVIWDPFAGLGTTAVAAIELQRKCYCAEINEDVFLIAVNRSKQKLENGTQGTLEL